MEAAEEKLKELKFVDPEKYSLSEIVQAEFDLETTTETYNRMVNRFKIDFPGVKHLDI